MRIVVVEDEDNIREGIIKLIGRMEGRYEVVGEADNGRDGFEIIRTAKPDLVITDIKMPFMTGIEMLGKLKEEGHSHKTFILTGFSEFEYAKKALQLGVVDYLEKPITADDLRIVLKKIEQELIYQQLGGLTKLSPSEQTEHLIVRTVFQEELAPALLTSHMQYTMDLNPELPFQHIQWYAGSSFQEIWRLLQGSLPDLLHPLSQCHLFPLAIDKSINLFMQNSFEVEPMKAHLLERLVALLPVMSKAVVVSWIKVPNLAGLKDGFTELQSLRKWSISDMQVPILSKEAILKSEKHTLQYAEQFDNRIAVAIAELNREAIEKIFADWLAYCFGGPYHPQQIIDATVRFVSEVLKQISIFLGDDIAFSKQSEWLNPIMHAQTRAELTEAVYAIAGQTMMFQKESSYSLIVMKALQHIHRRYHEGINLEQVSCSLHITPEYLSSLFTKEVKKTFTSFVKEYRIQKAKELLMHSNLKAFEIAEAVGYFDAKYFSRVFKEVTGLSPGEYQRINSQ